GVGPVVDVLRQQEGLVGVLAPDEAHGVHVEKQASRTLFGAHFRVKDVGLAEAQVETLEALGMLVQQVTEVLGRSVRRRDREQHRSPFSGRRRRREPEPASPYLHGRKVILAAQAWGDRPSEVGEETPARGSTRLDDPDAAPTSAARPPLVHATRTL